MKFYDGNPNDGGTLIGTDDIAVWKNATARAQVGVARSEGNGQWRPTHKVPIKGRRAWLKLARSA